MDFCGNNLNIEVFEISMYDFVDTYGHLDDDFN